MDSSDKYQLQWNGFEGNASSSFKDLIADTNFLDVTLASSDCNQVKAHKLILSSSSTFFQDILSKNTHQHPLIFMKGVNFDHLTSLIKFIYLGQVEVGQDKLDSFLSIAEDLKIKGLFGVAAQKTPDKPEPDKSFMHAVIREDTHEDKNNINKDINEKVELTAGSPQEDFAAFKSIGQVHFQAGSFEDLPLMDIDVSNIDFSTLSTLADIKQEQSEELSKEQPDVLTYPFKCDKCDYRAKKNSNLKRHKLAKHEGISFPCSYCGFPFKYKADLGRHIRTIHEGNKRPNESRIQPTITSGAILQDIVRIQNSL